MRIVIDLQACQSGSRLGGIGRYSLALAKAIAANRGSHELFLVLGDLLPLAEFDIRTEFAGLVEPERILTFSCPGPVAANDPANATRRRMAELVREDFIRQLAPDIVHVSSLVEGWGEDVVTSVGDPRLAERTAVTWYDLIPFMNPGTYLRDRDLADHYHGKVDEARKAGLLLAISQHSRDEAARELGLPDDRVVNIASGVDEIFRPVALSPERRRSLEERFGIRGPFLMYTGSFDARKNQARLVEAFARTPPAVRAAHQLVIAGNGWHDAYASLREVGRAAGLPEGRLVFTGRVSDDDLLALYNLTSLFVFPSLWEGFGLPVLEAMACGAPAIGSASTSVPEVIGRADALFDPLDVEAMARKITQAVTDDGFRRSLREHAAVHARKFSWRASARRALEAMESRAARLSGGRGDRGYGGLVDGLAEVARRGRCGPQDLADAARAVARNESRAGPAASGAVAARRPRVGWVTTWGTRCGIASYSRYLVEAAPWPAAAIFAERGRAAPAAAEPAPVAACWQAGTAESLDALAGELDARGIDAVVLQFNYGFFDFAALNAFLRRQASAGRAVVVICHSTTDPPPRILARKLADLAPGLAACDRVLVHSERDVENLRRIGITRNVSLFPHGIPASAASAVRGRHDGFTLATYGFCLPHKGLLEMVEAFAELARADATLRLKMVNAEYPARASGELIDALRGRVRSLGLEGRVTLVTDYLPDAESLGHLAAADLVVFPYQHTGESSSAAVRIGLAAGRPVAVTPLPIFADVAEVVHTLPGTDRAALVAGLGGLVARIRSGSDEGVAAVTAAATNWCRSRSYRVVSAQLHALLEQLGAGRAEAA